MDLNCSTSPETPSKPKLLRFKRFIMVKTWISSIFPINLNSSILSSNTKFFKFNDLKPKSFNPNPNPIQQSPFSKPFSNPNSSSILKFLLELPSSPTFLQLRILFKVISFLGYFQGLNLGFIGIRCASSEPCELLSSKLSPSLFATIALHLSTNQPTTTKTNYLRDFE